MDNRLAPIKLDSYQPLREVVCESLREAIRRGILKPGERVMEIQLAEELGVSRTPVREAIRKLELEGYVVMMPRRGTYVANMSIRDIMKSLRSARHLSRCRMVWQLSISRTRSWSICNGCWSLLAAISKKAIWRRLLRRILNSTISCIMQPATSGWWGSSRTCVIS